MGSRPRLDGGPQDKREGGAHTPNFTLTLSFRLDDGAHPADIEKFHRTTAMTVCLVLHPHAVPSTFSSSSMKCTSAILSTKPFDSTRTWTPLAVLH